MAVKIAFGGTPTNYSFPLAGRRILYAPVNTALPAAIVPIYDTSLPSAPVGWADLGVVVNSIVEVNVDFTVGRIRTGVIQQTRRTYIDDQTGRITAKLFSWEPGRTGVITGQGTPTVTASTSINRSFVDLFYGGTLGSKIACLVWEDFDIPAVEDTAGSSYEQVWLYSPTVQRAAGINLSEQETKTPVITFDYELLPYTSAAASGRDILIQQRWLKV